MLAKDLKKPRNQIQKERERERDMPQQQA
uniref:Uncharacterized protein n=1 Tax=Rhizophora mucronata TaxID=61149 RepID=A0A2P2MTU7_RHIMU